MSISISYGNSTIAVAGSNSPDFMAPTERVLLTKGTFLTDDIVLMSNLDLIENEIPDHGTTTIKSGSLSGVDSAGGGCNLQPVDIGNHIGALTYYARISGYNSEIHTATGIDLDDANDTERVIEPIRSTASYGDFLVPTTTDGLFTPDNIDHRFRITVTDGTNSWSMIESFPRYYGAIAASLTSVDRNSHSRGHTIAAIAAFYRYIKLRT